MLESITRTQTLESLQTFGPVWPVRVFFFFNGRTIAMLACESCASEKRIACCWPGISNQCTPYPCYKEGSEGCVDGHAAFTCVCKPGWKGLRCEDGSFHHFASLHNESKCKNCSNSFIFTLVLNKSANLATDSQTSTSARIQTILQDVTKNVRTSPAVSSAAVETVTSPTTKSTAWVRADSSSLLCSLWWEKLC